MGISYWDLWAKANYDGSWQALPCHLLDVAAAAENLWRHLPPSSTAVPRTFFGDGVNVPQVIAFLAASHDIGKANKFFQGKADAQRGRLESLGLKLGGPELTRHGQATGSYLFPWLKKRFRWDDLSSRMIARAVGGHHGVFFPDENLTRLEVNAEPWSSIGPQLLDDLADSVFQPSPVAISSEQAMLNPFLAWLSGFVTVADWLGSHSDMTRWCTERTDLSAYYTEALARAENVLHGQDWRLPVTSLPLDLEKLVPAGRRPNSLQKLANSVSKDFSLAIVEAPTGEGKTEAAFCLCEPHRAVGEGIYFALPTMATANGLYNRVDQYLREGLKSGQPFDVKLLHSMAWLLKEQSDYSATPNTEHPSDSQEATARDWFNGGKRGLLSPYAVGTIDQILIAALRTRHGFVRLFALAGKVVVIDEVHAYDVYMGELLDTLLGWLKSLCCKVVLLSATLPEKRRCELIKAWGVTGEVDASNYPAITWVCGDGTVTSRSFDVQERKPVTFSPIATVARSDEETPEWVVGADRILEKVKEKVGLAALVLNTVNAAQEAYDYIKARAPHGVEVMLFHARFTVQDRISIEQKVLNQFGKSGDRSKPAILVATQVVEQSLDLDFDHMVSELAPVDLLIQRAGRLHRHRRNWDGTLRLDDGLDERENTVLDVIIPPSEMESSPSIARRVYARAILLRTLEWVSNTPTICTPSHIRDAIEQVYSESEKSSVREAWQSSLQEFSEELQTHTQKMESAAGQAMINRVDYTDRFLTETTLHMDENDERSSSMMAAKTRLEDRPSVSVVLCLGKDEGMDFESETPFQTKSDVIRSSLKITPPFDLWRELILLPEAKFGRGELRTLRQHRVIKWTGNSALVGSYEVLYNKDRGLSWRRKHNE